MRYAMMIGWALAALAATGCADGGSGLASAVCGDQACNGDETCATCAGDCGSCNVAYCGDGACNGAEFCGTCSLDCGACPGDACGDDSCDGAETCLNCSGDCGFCDAAVCGDGTCALTESCATCALDCGGCGVLCGAQVCAPGLVCSAQSSCEAPCVPQCDGKVCGDDGCGGSCGTCGDGTACNASFQCVATGPTCSCDGKACGDDGCGGSCGTCGDGTACNASFQCVATDPCQGIPATGCCEADQTLVWCDDGRQELGCADFGGVCTWNGEGGFGCDLGSRETPAGTPTACPGTATTNACAGRECGSNLGVDCGDCEADEICAQGICTTDLCAGITFEGCCFGDYAVWCADGALQVADCAGDGTTCGWTGDETFYYCDGTGADPSGTWPIVCDVGAGSPSTGTIVYGDLVISEVMVDPTKVDDSDGEWFEVANASAKTFNIRDLQVEGAGSEGFTVGFDIVLGPGDRAVFTRWVFGDNGGVQPDQVWAGSSLSLTNTSDTLRLRWDGALVDEVRWDTAAGWTVPAGRSLVLRASKHDADANDAASAWCTASTTYGDGDYGTPGAADPSCP